MKERYRLIILSLGFLIIILLGASIINDILFLVFKDIINKTLFNIISTVVIFIMIWLLFNLSPFNVLKEKLNEFEDKLKKRK